MAIQDKQAGKVAKLTNTDRSGNSDKIRNQPAVNQGISNAGPTGNRNDRSDKGGMGSDDGKLTPSKETKGKPGNRSGSKSNPEKK